MQLILWKWIDDSQTLLAGILNYRAGIDAINIPIES
jgi:hypothetical protein